MGISVTDEESILDMTIQFLSQDAELNAHSYSANTGKLH